MGGQGRCSVSADENNIFNNHNSGRKILINLLILCGLNCDYQNVILISTNTTLALAAHFDFSSFSSWPFLSSWPLLFFTLRVFLN